MNRRIRKYFFYVLLGIAVNVGACKSAHYPKERKPRKIKSGKPIPCPIKDC